MHPQNTAPGAGRLLIEREARPLVIKRHDAVIAASNEALLVTQDGGSPVYYVPRKDVYMEHLTESDEPPADSGDGAPRYWSVVASGGGVANAVWTLTKPGESERQLADHLGFDPNPFNITVG
ncbi:DUF427 domain-containing protein [Aureimonas populi]|uniref:DUF427 domain-containing protein n=1 Tax=Aureimonas populi TaxID=1701758 RepID=A0ABW5CR75_9HYPH|nr:DUF427 domain-containing protein [Aureimonas populi]